MPILLQMLGEYSTGEYSYSQVANHLNANGYKTQTNRYFTGYNVRDVLSNRFYEGKIVHHEGQPDEMIIKGSHRVPDEVKQLWQHCQVIKKARLNRTSGHPRGESHDYPFSKVLKCHRCGNAYHGEAVYYKGKADLRLTHERRAMGKQCEVLPRSRSVASVSREFADRVLAYVTLDEGWKQRMIAALTNNGGVTEAKANQVQAERLHKAIENLRKQHLWGDISDINYERERSELERQLKAVTPDTTPIELPNLERAAKLLNELPALWQHPGVTDKERESVIQEVFTKISIEGDSLVSIEPKPDYAPLFADIVLQNSLGYRGLKSPPSPPETRMSS
jgi:hypothetical protein